MYRLHDCTCGNRVAHRFANFRWAETHPWQTLHDWFKQKYLLKVPNIRRRQRGLCSSVYINRTWVSIKASVYAYTPHCTQTNLVDNKGYLIILSRLDWWHDQNHRLRINRLIENQTAQQREKHKHKHGSRWFKPMLLRERRTKSTLSKKK